MKNTLKVILALTLILSMMLPMLPVSAEDPMEIIWVGFSDPPEDGGEYQKMLEEKFNVKLIPAQVNAQDVDAINLWIAANNDFDVINLTNGKNMYDTLVENDMVRTFPEEWLYEYMPCWMAKVAEMAGGDASRAVDQVRAEEDGELYAVPLLMANFAETGIFLIRQDWLDAVGMTMPTNLDEFHEVLKAFTFNDPDGNGIQDTYGMNGNGRYYFNYVFATFGIQYKSYYLQDDGSVIYTSATEAYKDALKLIQGWYKEGIIDPETITDDRTKQREKWAQGVFGILPDNASWCNGQLQKMVLDVNPDAKISYMPAFEGYGSYVDFPNALGNQGAFMLGCDVSDEKAIKIMQIKEAFAADEELYNLVYWGVEGEDYFNVNGFFVRPDDWTDNKDKYNGVNRGLGYYWAMQPKSFAEYGHEVKEEYADAHVVAMANAPVFYGTNFTAIGVNEAKNWYGADVTTLADEYYGKAVMGEIDIDATWDEYIASLKAAGLDKILAEYEEMLK